jgi:hypothetical protein
VLMMVGIGEMVIEGQDGINTLNKYSLRSDGETVKYRRASDTGKDDDVSSGVLDSDIFYRIISLDKLSVNPVQLKEFLGEELYLEHLYNGMDSETRAGVVKEIASKTDLAVLTGRLAQDESRKHLCRVLEE